MPTLIPPREPPPPEFNWGCVLMLITNAVILVALLYLAHLFF